MRMLTSVLGVLLAGVSAPPCCGPCGDCCQDGEEDAEKCDR